MKVIKEQNMTETLFEIVSLNNPLYPQSPLPSNTYSSLLQNFCTASYGLYTQLFIKRIADDALLAYPHLYKFLVKKHLRKCVKKFMLTDLQLIFLAHYCTVNQWDIGSKKLMREVKKQDNCTSQELQEKYFQIFLSMNAYFVKSYVGDIQQFQAISIQLNEQFPNFLSIYEKWIHSRSKQLFLVNPKTINKLYKYYSKCCQQQRTKKDYNDLVDTLIQLSTSYSMIPSKENKHTKSKYQSSSREELTKNRRKSKQREHQIPKIDQKQQNLQHSSLSSQLFQLNKSKIKNKSSFLLLQNLQPPSDQILVSTLKKQQPIIDIQYSRSREKKPANKVSLSFKRKQKPNETVLGYIAKQPSAMQIVPDSIARFDSRSILNQSILENNISFINLRSSRSSKNNSNLPFSWRPPEDNNFFDKTKLN